MPNLGSKVKGTLVSFVSDVLETLGTKIVWVANVIYTALIANQAELVADSALSVVRKIVDEDNVPDSFKEVLSSVDAAEGFAKLWLAMIIIIGIPMALMQAGAAPTVNMAQRKALHALPTVLAPYDAVIAAMHRGLIPEPVAMDKLREMGFDADEFQIMKRASRPLASAFEYIQYWLRGGLNEAQIDAKLSAMGYDSDDINLFTTLGFYIPPPPDLIRMAVREVFTPEIAEKFGQYEQFPEAFAEWGAKQGLSREWCVNYWAAHWELPSPQMGFEMRHRRIIDDETLDLLLRAQDVMPFWRDKITAITYNPYTRVDVRRMFGVGVLTEEQVYNNYLDLGYDPEHATNLTEYAVRSTKEATLELAKGEILTGYRERVLSEQEASFALANLGYDEGQINYLLAIEDSKFAAEQQKERITLLQTKFKSKQLSMTEYQAELGKLNLPATQMEILIAQAELQATVKITMPSKEEIIRWYQAGTLESDDAEDALDALGYDSRWIDLFLSEITRTPSVAMVIRWYNKGLISAGQTDKYLSDLKYGKTERELLILEASTKEPVLFKLPSLATVKKWYSTQYVPETEARMYLMQMGYGDKEINLFISEWAPPQE